MNHKPIGKYIRGLSKRCFVYTWELRTQDKGEGQQQKRRFTLLSTHNTMVKDYPDTLVTDI